MEEAEKYSYSKLSLFDKCPYRFKLKYEDKNHSESSSLALEIGTLAHKCKELVALDMIAGRPVDYEHVRYVLYSGFVPEASEGLKDSGVDDIPGLDVLKMRYAFDWIAPDTKSGLTYDQKIQIFLDHLQDMEKDEVCYLINLSSF